MGSCSENDFNAFQNMGEERLSNPPDTDLTNEAAFLVPPQFSRLRGMDRAASVMSFQVNPVRVKRL